MNHPPPGHYCARHRWTLLALTLLGAALLSGLLSACNNGGDDSPLAKPITPELQQVLEQVAALRQLPAPIGLKVGAISRDDVPSALERTLTAEDGISFEHLTTLYRLLGHLGPDEDYRGAYLAFAGGNVIGFYSPRDKEFFVVTSGGSVELSALDKQERSTVAHELTHAVQDGNFDLEATINRTRDDLDWSLALSSVIEGDAVNIEGSWTREHAYLPQPNRAFLASLSATQSVPVSIEREFRFPYTTGAEWVSIVRSTRGNEAINGVLKGRRLTTAELIHPDLYDSGFSPDQIVLPDISHALGGGWKHESGGAFGEFQLRNYLQLKLTALPATVAATGWRADRYDAYRDGSSAAAVFRVRFATAADAQEFVSAQDTLFANSNARVDASTSTVAGFPDGRTTIRAQVAGADVLFVIGSSRTIAESAFKALAGG
ncbi:MAG: hypothetical protein ABI577_06650 [bacterium]